MIENLHVFYCFFLWSDISNDVIIWNQMAVKYAKAHVYLLYFPGKEGCYSVSPWTQNFLIPSFENSFPLWMFTTFCFLFIFIYFFLAPSLIIVKPINLVTWIFCLNLLILGLEIRSLVLEIAFTWLMIGWQKRWECHLCSY